MISLLLPFHREGSLLGRAIESVLTQTCKAWQLVLIANNADAETRHIGNAFAQNDSRIEIFEETTPGISHALNTGLKHCKGVYIARLDADDAMPPERLALQKQFLDTHTETGLVSGKIHFISKYAAGYDHYVDQINSWVTSEDISRYRFVESPVAHPSVMFRRELIDRYGGYSTAAVPEDYELWMRWLTAGVLFAKIPEVVLHWYDSPQRLSRTHLNFSRRAFDAVRMEHLLQILPGLLKGRPLWVCGGKYARKKITWFRNRGLHVAGVVDLVERNIHGLESMTYAELPAPGSIFLVSMVSNRGGYRIVEKVLTEKGYRWDQDFILAG